MPEFPLLKSQIGQVEWNGGSSSIFCVLRVFVVAFVVAYSIVSYNGKQATRAAINVVKFCNTRDYSFNGAVVAFNAC
jgi:hypothetical protein